MSITVNLYYTGTNGNAHRFAEEMERTGIAGRIRAEEGNLKYEYFTPLGDSETVLLIDSWENQEAIDSSGIGRSGQNLADNAGTGTWLDGTRFGAGASEDEIRSWIEGLQ